MMNILMLLTVKKGHSYQEDIAKDAYKSEHNWRRAVGKMTDFRKMGTSFLFFR